MRNLIADAQPTTVVRPRASPPTRCSPMFTLRRRVETSFEPPVELVRARVARLLWREHLELCARVVAHRLEPPERAIADDVRCLRGSRSAHEHAASRPHRRLWWVVDCGAIDALGCEPKRWELSGRHAVEVDRRHPSAHERRVPRNITRRILSVDGAQRDAWDARRAQQVVEDGAGSDRGELLLVADDQKHAPIRKRVEEPRRQLHVEHRRLRRIER